MSAAPESHPETSLQKERRLFGELLNRLVNAILNWVFDLRPERAQRRARNLFILFLFSGFLIALFYYPLGLWAGYIQDIFLYLLNPAYAASYVGNPFTKFLTFLYQVFSDAHTLQYFPIFLAPFYIALQLASYYLADIFELDDVAVARSFIWEVAFSGSDETMHISHGEVSDKDRESSNYLIGGPGKVIVDLDSIALFEKADGTPHVIGPTGKEPGGRATIDGFERFRQAIDIRDQHVDLTVPSRSLDGIPISAVDVRLMFSIDRGENPQPSPEFPYPFEKSAIEKFVYKSSSKVTPDQPSSSDYEFSWINNMNNLIRGGLSKFMSERNLADYLANIGLPEVEDLNKREVDIANDVRRLAQPPEEGGGKKPKSPPPFTPRYEITKLFSQFTDEFTKEARNRGVVLHWIGVGTWKTALLGEKGDIVTDNHVEAWRIIQENRRKGTQGAMDVAENAAMLEKMELLIRRVPIEVYEEITGKKHSKKHGFKTSEAEDDEEAVINEEELFKMFNEGNVSLSDIAKRINRRADRIAREKEKEPPNRRTEIRKLLMEYRDQLVEAVRFMEAKNEPVPESIREAIKYINDQMGFKHFIGSSPITPPNS